MYSLEFSISANSTERVDRFLADQLSLSRSVTARALAEGRVRVNGETVRGSRKLVREDLVEVTWPDAEVRTDPEQLNLNLAIVYEDASMLVVDKPPGLVVHPAPGHRTDTLISALAARGMSLSGGAEERPGVVHRLDRDTSGLLIVAKTSDCHRKLVAALGRREIERRYAALVWGHIDSARSVDAPVGRHPGDRKRMMVIASGRAAKTLIEPVARFGPCDLIRLTLTTGRTHQIRVHLAHIGHPVIGDPTYGGGGSKRVSGPDRVLAAAVDRAAPRQALHAAWLRFLHPESGELLDLRSEWPHDLRQALGAAAQQRNLLDRLDMLEYLEFFGGEGSDPGRNRG